MKFEITDGLSIISIGLNDIGSYFSYNNPLTTVWYDCAGSAGKYLCQLPYDEKYRIEVRKKIIENLNTDYSDNIEELHNLIYPLLRLFPNGEYHLNFYNNSNSKYFEHSYLKDGISTSIEYNWFFVFSESINLAEIDSKILEHKAFVKDREEKKQISWNILEFTTSGFYEGNDKSFVATQPKSEINEERVKYFEDKISNGERPFIIIFNSYFNQHITNIDNSISQYSMTSENYVLDGHHKLLAYQNLKINPSIVEITHQPKTKDEIEFDIEKLIEVMYPWQIEHILENWSSRDEYIMEALNNPKSKIHNFIKNGFYQEFYENGQLKHEAFYINNRVDGVTKGWYDNGQLEYRYLYENQLYKEGETWYKSGKIKSVSDNRISYSVNYYENGNIRSKYELIDDNKIHFQQGWYENGIKEFEVKSVMTGGLIMRKNFNRKGNIENFEEFDTIEQKLVQRK